MRKHSKMGTGKGCSVPQILGRMKQQSCLRNYVSLKAGATDSYGILTRRGGDKVMTRNSVRQHGARKE